MDPLALPRRRLRPVHWIALDCAFTVLMALVYEWKAAPFVRGIPGWAAVAIVAIAVIPAAWRRRWLRSALALVVTAGAVATAFSSSPVPPVAAAFVIYVIPLRLPGREALRLLVRGVAAAVGGHDFAE
jgi:hypothetical protein